MAVKDNLIFVVWGDKELELYKTIAKDYHE